MPEPETTLTEADVRLAMEGLRDGTYQGCWPHIVPSKFLPRVTFVPDEVVALTHCANCGQGIGLRAVKPDAE